MKIAHNCSGIQRLLNDSWLNDEGPISKRLAQRFMSELAIMFLNVCKVQAIMDWDCSELEGVDPRRQYLAWLDSEEFKEWMRSNHLPDSDTNAFKKG